MHYYLNFIIIKQFLACLFALICTSISIATPPIVVERLPQWGAEYFTIVNTQAFDILKFSNTELINAHIPEANMEYFVPASQSYLNCKVYGSRSMASLIQFPDLYYRYVGLELGDVIIEIDGESTRNMSYERFYELLSDNAHIVYLRKEMGELKQYDTNIERCNHPEYLTQRGIYDWFTANTYDFIIIGEDPLTDKEYIMNKEYDCWNSRSKTPLMEFLANQNTIDLRFEFRLMFNGVNTKNRKIPFSTNHYKLTLKRDNKKQTITIPYPYDKITYTHYYMTR